MVTQNHASENTEKLKEIPKWTRRYAQNRTLTTFLVIVITGFFSMVIAALSYLAGATFLKGHITVFRVCIIILFTLLIFAFIIRVSKFSGFFIRRWIDQLIYSHEGNAFLQEQKLTKKKKWLTYIVGPAVGGCIIGTYYLSMEGYIAFKYMQPISAIYLVPGLIHLYFLRRPRIGPLDLICPILYAIHAILIVAGVPLYFTGNLSIWNIALPLFGYTLIAHIIGHLYSRYSLKKLKDIAHLEGDAANGD